MGAEWELQATELAEELRAVPSTQLSAFRLGSTSPRNLRNSVNVLTNPSFSKTEQKFIVRLVLFVCFK